MTSICTADPTKHLGLYHPQQYALVIRIRTTAITLYTSEIFTTNPRKHLGLYHSLSYTLVTCICTSDPPNHLCLYQPLHYTLFTRIFTNKTLITWIGRRYIYIYRYILMTMNNTTKETLGSVPDTTLDKSN